MAKSVAGLSLALVLSACGSSASAGRQPGAGTTASSAPPTTTTATGETGAITYGIDVNQFDADIGAKRVPQVLQMIHAAGARAVRIGGVWATVESSPGRFDWSSVDRLFSLARADDLTVLFELGTEPAWDAPGGNTNAPPVDCNTPAASCTSVSEYVNALVTHAAPEGLHYLVPRNEPQNFAKNWVGGTAGAYAHFEQVVYRAAHHADPSIRVLSGGTEQVSVALQAVQAKLQPPTPYEQEVTAFAASLYRDPAWCDSIDVLDIHVGDHGPIYSLQIVDDSEQALKACDGGRHLPVWVTEVGYPSVPVLQNSPVYQEELRGTYEGGESGQARFLSDTFAALAKDPNVIGIDWTFMIDPNQTNTVPPGTTYNKAFSAGVGAGLAYSDYKTKASYQAFQEASSGSP